MKNPFVFILILLLLLGSALYTQVHVIIGDGNSDLGLPVHPYYGYSYSQSIFLQDEIDVPNQWIEKLYYYWNGYDAAPCSKDWVIFMGHTDRNSFATSSDWLPLSELSQVFDGIVYITNRPGWVEIVLHTPFVYNNSQNLVIAVDENTPSYDGHYQYFFSTFSPEHNRSLKINIDNTNPDPAFPPLGSLMAAYPNIKLQFGEIDLPDYISFPVLQVNMQESIPSLDLNEYFSSAYPLVFSCFSEEAINCGIDAAGILNISVPEDWHGVSYLCVRASILPDIYVELILKLIVVEKEFIYQDFNHCGALPGGWTQNHNGTTNIPWQPLPIAGDNYALHTSASIGTTMNERLISTTFNLSTLKDIVVSFDSDFLPYANASGSFAYSFNNVTYTTVESYSTAHNGRKNYLIPNLEGKPNVRFRWTYGTNSVNWGEDNHWIIDNFSIYGIVRDTTPPELISGFQISDYHSEYLELIWQPSSDDYFARYEIYISDDEEVDTADQLWSVEEDANLAFGTCSNTRIGGLEPAMYWLAIRAVDLSGNASALSNIVPFYANDGAGPVISNPIPAPQPLPNWQDNNEVVIGCTITDNNLIDPATIMYRVDLNANGSYDEDENWQPALVRSRNSGFQNEYEIEVALQLEHEGVIAFEFKAQDVYGNISYSGVQGAEGIEDDWILHLDLLPPAEMDFFFVQDLADNSVTLGWDASYDMNFMGYRIFYGAAEDELDMIWDWEDDENLTEAGTGLIFTTITGLQSSTKYWFQLSAWDWADASTLYPDIISVTTSYDAEPKAPQNLSLEVHGDILLLYWDAVNEDTLGNPIEVSAYHIYLGDHPYFDCNFDSYFFSTPQCSIEMEYIVEYVDRLFFKVIAEAGAVRKNMDN